jgi:hypothetical protein
VAVSEATVAKATAAEFHYENSLGVFLLRRGTFMDTLKVAQGKQQVLRAAGIVPEDADASAIYLAVAAATLDLLAVEKPDYDLEKLEAVDALLEVYQKFEEWRASFRAPGDRPSAA